MFAAEPGAIIDSGSNSVRLVVYSGATRIPSIIFNEKVLAGLGGEMDETGAIGEEAGRRALAALERFRMLTARMGVVRARVVVHAHGHLVAGRPERRREPPCRSQRTRAENSRPSRPRPPGGCGSSRRSGTRSRARCGVGRAPW